MRSFYLIRPGLHLWTGGSAIVGDSTTVWIAAAGLDHITDVLRELSAEGALGRRLYRCSWCELPHPAGRTQSRLLTSRLKASIPGFGEGTVRQVANEFVTVHRAHERFPEELATIFGDRHALLVGASEAPLPDSVAEDLLAILRSMTPAAVSQLRSRWPHWRLARLLTASSWSGAGHDGRGQLQPTKRFIVELVVGAPTLAKVRHVLSGTRGMERIAGVLDVGAGLGRLTVE